MLVSTTKGLVEILRDDYANDRDFYRAVLKARFNVFLNYSFGAKL